MTLTLPFSILGLSPLTMSSALFVVHHLVTWLMPPWLRTLRSSTSFVDPPPNAYVTTTVALSMGACMEACMEACMAASTAVAVTWAWGMPQLLQKGELSRHQWWWASSHHTSPTTPHQQVDGASWWWSIAILRMGQKGTGQRRRMIWWSMVPLPASTTCTTISCTMAH